MERAKATSSTCLEGATPQQEPALKEHGLALSKVFPASQSAVEDPEGQQVLVDMEAVPKGTTPIHL
jgi:hypothetical protein